MSSGWTGAWIWGRPGNGWVTTSRFRATWIRRCCSPAPTRSAAPRGRSSMPRPAAPGPSSTWATASTRRRRGNAGGEREGGRGDGPRDVRPVSAVDAVLLIAFGGPERPEDIRPFLQIVTEGRRIPPERLEEVAHHYE